MGNFLRITKTTKSGLSAGEDLLRLQGIFSVIPVCIGPGQTAFIVTPEGPSSTANALVKPTTPCLEAVYGLMPAEPPSPSVLAIFTTLPC